MHDTDKASMILDEIEKKKHKLENKLSRTKAEAKQYSKIMRGVIYATATLSMILPFTTAVAIPVLADLIFEIETALPLPFIIGSSAAVFGMMLCAAIFEVRTKTKKEKEFNRSVTELNNRLNTLIGGYERVKLKYVTKDDFTNKKDIEKQQKKEEYKPNKTTKYDLKKIKLSMKTHEKYHKIDSKGKKAVKYTAKGYSTAASSPKSYKVEKNIPETNPQKLKANPKITQLNKNNSTPSQKVNSTVVVSPKTSGEKFVSQKINFKAIKNKKSSPKTLKAKEKWDKGEWDKLHSPKSKVEKIKKKREKAKEFTKTKLR